MDYTTLNKIRKHSPCEDGWTKLLSSLGKTKADNVRLSYKHILEINGFEDALWTLKTHKDENKVRLFAADIAERVLHIFEEKRPDDDRPRKAIQAARDFANGKIDEDACKDTCKAAREAVREVYDAAYAASVAASEVYASDNAYVARAAADAAWSIYAATYTAAYSATVAATDAATDAADIATAARYASDETEEQIKLFKKYFC
jgi:hypothetical protein